LGYCVGAFGRAEFVVDGVDVGFDCVVGDVEFFGDFGEWYRCG